MGPPMFDIKVRTVQEKVESIKISCIETRAVKHASGTISVVKKLSGSEILTQLSRRCARKSHI